MGMYPGWSVFSKDDVTTVIDCCGNLEVTSEDEKEFLFWEILYDDVNETYDKVADGEIVGVKDTCKAEALLDLHHLLMFLQLIDKERQYDASISSTGLDQGATYYIQKYCTVAIRDKFYCKGFRIETILKVFDLFDLAYESDGGSSTQDGIGYMQIEGESDPIFRIF